MTDLTDLDPERVLAGVAVTSRRGATLAAQRTDLARWQSPAMAEIVKAGGACTHVDTYQRCKAIAAHLERTGYQPRLDSDDTALGLGLLSYAAPVLTDEGGHWARRVVEAYEQRHAALTYAAAAERIAAGEDRATVLADLGLAS